LLAANHQLRKRIHGGIERKESIQNGSEQKRAASNILIFIEEQLHFDAPAESSPGIGSDAPHDASGVEIPNARNLLHHRSVIEITV
jgi:hypothetical protein